MDITKARLQQIILEELQTIETGENKENLTVDIPKSQLMEMIREEFKKLIEEKLIEEKSKEVWYAILYTQGNGKKQRQDLRI